MKVPAANGRDRNNTIKGAKIMKRLWIIISIPVALVIISTVGLWVYISFFIDNNLIVQQVESNINARVELKKVRIGLFSLLPSLSCEDVALAPRDTFASSGKHLDDRPALRSPLISIEKIDFKASLLPLLAKRFVLQRFLINKPEIQMILYENGKNNLSPIFAVPPIVNGKANPVFEKTQKDVSDKKTPRPKTDDTPFSVHDLPISAQINRMGLTHARVEMRVQKTNQRFQISDLDLIIGSIDIDPNDLINHNRAAIQFDTNVMISGQDNSTQAKLKLASSGNIEPFDPKSGFINPGIVYRIRLKQESFISSLIALDQLKESLSALSRIGLNMEKLTQKAELSKDTETGIAYKNGRISFVHDLSFPTQHYDLYIRKNSWANIINIQHGFNGHLVLSKEASASALADVDQFIEKQAAALAEKKVAIDTNKIRDQLLDGLVKDGRIFLGFTSKGNMRKPVIKLTVTPPSLEAVLKDTLKDTVQDKIMEKIEDDLSPEQKDAAKKILKGFF